MAAVSGYKTYMLLALAGLVTVAEGWFGMDVPGVTVDSSAVWNSLWDIGLIGAFRSAIGKV